MTASCVVSCGETNTSDPPQETDVDYVEDTNDRTMNQHLVPLDELGDHDTSGIDACDCKPFTYARITDTRRVIGYEIRHNSFDALPVDEELLEKVQGVR
jgi:hypothetical protein